MDGALAFYHSFTLVLILPFGIAHPRFDMNAYCAELYREACGGLWVVRTTRTGLFGRRRGVCDSGIDGIAHLDIVWGP